MAPRKKPTDRDALIAHLLAGIDRSFASIASSMRDFVTIERERFSIEHPPKPAPVQGRIHHIGDPSPEEAASGTPEAVKEGRFERLYREAEEQRAEDARQAGRHKGNRKVAPEAGRITKITRR